MLSVFYLGTVVNRASDTWSSCQCHVSTSNLTSNMDPDPDQIIIDDEIEVIIILFKSNV